MAVCSPAALRVSLLDRGHTRIHVWRGGQETVLETQENYAASLPHLLQSLRPRSSDDENSKSSATRWSRSFCA